MRGSYFFGRREPVFDLALILSRRPSSRCGGFENSPLRSVHRSKRRGDRRACRGPSQAPLRELGGAVEYDPFVGGTRLRTPLLVGAGKRSKFAHIPPGHDPGPQTLRNQGGSTLWEWFTGFVGTGMVIGGLFLAAGGRGPRFNPWEEGIGGTVFAFFGAVCVLWAYSLRRKRSPLSLADRLPGAALSVGSEEARRGGKLSVTLTVASSGGPDDEPLELGLVCVELYDYRVTAQTRAGPIYVRQTGEAHAYEHWEHVERSLGSQTVELELPRDAPYSYEGDCVSYAWRVSARVARRLRSDPRIDHPIWVRP